jgi:CDGSH-type Zn-finger protein
MICARCDGSHATANHHADEARQATSDPTALSRHHHYA